MQDEEITIDGAVYILQLSRSETKLRTTWVCKSCGCGECCTTIGQEKSAIQFAKAIIKEHHRLHHAPRTLVHRLTWATG
jgi:hypothetical protein